MYKLNCVVTFKKDDEYVSANTHVGDYRRVKDMPGRERAIELLGGIEEIVSIFSLWANGWEPVTIDFRYTN